MIELAEVKQALNVIGDDQDTLINRYIVNAKAFIEAHCDRKIVETDTENPEEMKFDGVIEQAMLQLVGMFYENREDQSFGNGGVPYHTVIDRLLWTKKRF